jgi:dihydroorotase
MADTLGALRVGREADVSVLSKLSGRFDLSDNSGEHVTASEMLVPEFALRAGIRHNITSPLVPAPMEVAA